MNIAILGNIGKWISCLLVGFTSFFSGSVIEKEKLEATNLNENKSYSTLNEVIPYESKIIYNSKLPSTIQKTVKEGEVGIITTINNEKQLVKQPVAEIIEQGTGAKGEYTGKVTSYSPDCAGCSKTGAVACHTKNRGTHSLINDGIYYNDEEFGNVRILSTASSLPCGTIIKIDNGKIEPYYGVVLDRGTAMNKAWQNGIVWIDVAYASNQDIQSGNTSGTNVNFSVQRWGF